MNEYERENLVGMGRAAASWAMYKSDDFSGQDIILFNSIVEREHTRYAVTQNTGDARLGRRAGVSAGARLMAWIYAAAISAFAVFGIGLAASMNVAGHDDVNGASGASQAFFWIGVLGAIFVGGCCLYMARRTTARSLYTRLQGNLPTPKELNKSGYWEVEPDIWQ